MNIFMTGGTGFLGTALVKALLGQGHAVTVLSRSAVRGPLPAEVRLVTGNPVEEGAWQEAVPAHEAVVNLAGASIFNRWSTEYKEIMRRSRIATTRNLVAAMATSRGKTRLLLNASAVGYYGFHGDEELDEAAPPGDDFLAMLCREWEEGAMEAEGHGVRVVRCRLGIVLGAGGGAFEKMLPAFKAGMGSPLGSGRQWFSWIHRRDLIRIFLFLLANETISGPVNCTAPRPVTNREMSKALGEALHRPVIMPRVPAFALKLALGELGDIVLKGQRALPRKLLGAGFTRS
ncbi:MAG: TIGR01777 family oxidoreductase, partial [Desulfobacteraceae bacterium]|nr:TIGR01777 family oxidoreductase [Desulfobacteraceae bacterium]